MGPLSDLLYPVASTWLTIGLALLALVALYGMLVARTNRAACVMVVVALAASALGYGSVFAHIEKNHDERMSAFDAERAARDAAADAEFEAIMDKHERQMKRVNARADRVLAREAERLGVPVETIDPRITGNWERWTYQPPTTTSKETR